MQFFQFPFRFMNPLDDLIAWHRQQMLFPSLSIQISPASDRLQQVPLITQVNPIKLIWSMSWSKITVNWALVALLNYAGRFEIKKKICVIFYDHQQRVSKHQFLNIAKASIVDHSNLSLRYWLISFIWHSSNRTPELPNNPTKLSLAAH